MTIKCYKYEGQAIRVGCRRCGRQMLKWEFTYVETPRFFFECICGRCITDADFNFREKTGGAMMDDQRETRGHFSLSSTTKKYHKFTIEATGGIIGYLFIPKDIREIPSHITLDHAMEGANHHAA